MRRRRRSACQSAISLPQAVQASQQSVMGHVCCGACAGDSATDQEFRYRCRSFGTEPEPTGSGPNQGSGWVRGLFRVLNYPGSGSKFGSWEPGYPLTSLRMTHVSLHYSRQIRVVDKFGCKNGQTTKEHRVCGVAWCEHRVCDVAWHGVNIVPRLIGRCHG